MMYVYTYQQFPVVFENHTLTVEIYFHDYAKWYVDQIFTLSGCNSDLELDDKFVARLTAFMFDIVEQWMIDEEAADSVARFEQLQDELYHEWLIHH